MKAHGFRPLREDRTKCFASCGDIASVRNIHVRVERVLPLRVFQLRAEAAVCERLVRKVRATAAAAQRRRGRRDQDDGEEDGGDGGNPWGGGGATAAAATGGSKGAFSVGAGAPLPHPPGSAMQVRWGQLQLWLPGGTHVCVDLFHDDGDGDDGGGVGCGVAGGGLGSAAGAAEQSPPPSVAAAAAAAAAGGAAGGALAGAGAGAGADAAAVLGAGGESASSGASKAVKTARGAALWLSARAASRRAARMVAAAAEAAERPMVGTAKMGGALGTKALLADPEEVSCFAILLACFFFVHILVVRDVKSRGGLFSWGNLKPFGGTLTCVLACLGACVLDARDGS